MPGSQPSFQKTAPVSVKMGGYAQTPHEKKNLSWPCCLQEQTSASAFENDHIVPVGILVGKICTSRAQTQNSY